MTVRQRMFVNPVDARGLAVPLELGSLRAEIVGKKGRIVEVGERDVLVEYDDPGDEVVLRVSLNPHSDAERLTLTGRITINPRPSLWQRLRAWWARLRAPEYVVPFEDDYPDSDLWR